MDDIGKGRVFVISGPSAVGKGTVRKVATPKIEGMGYSVSVTTREVRRSGEDNKQYTFATKEEFERRIAAGDFLEYVHQGGHYYGTPKAFVEQMLARGEDVLLEIETKGAERIRKMLGDTVSIFIAVRDPAELVHRIKNRQTDTPEINAERISRGLSELKCVVDYDYVVLNERDGVDACADEIVQIVKAERAKRRGGKPHECEARAIERAERARVQNNAELVALLVGAEKK